MDFYTKTKEETLDILHTQKEGLSTKETKTRIEKYGENIIQEKKRKNSFKIFLNQFTSPLIIILI
jgi:magnesium-transporting ATPase (P-type)